MTLPENKIYIPVLVGLSILVALFITSPLYSGYVEKSAEIATLEKTKSEQEAKLVGLQKIQNDMKSMTGSENPIVKKVKRLQEKFSIARVMETTLFNSYTVGAGSVGGAPVEIGNISVSQGTKLPNGLSMATVNVSVKARDVNTLIGYITYLTTEAPFYYTINTITLPLDVGEGAVQPSNPQVNLPLSFNIYYY